MKSKMTLKPEDRSRALLLGGATVVVLIVGIGNALHMLQSNPHNAHSGTVNPPAAGQASAATGAPAPAPGLSANFPGAVGATPLPTGTPTPVAVQAGIMGSKLDLYADDQPEAPITHDPFTPVIPLPPNNASRDGRAHARPSMASTTPVVSPIGTSIPNSVRPVTSGTVAVTKEADFMDATSGSERQTAELTLAGVISGPSAVAVLHQGDHCYPLLAGEKLPNQMTLTRITDTGIYLLTPSTSASHLPRKTWFLEIGKPLHMAIPIRSDLDVMTSPQATSVSR